MALDTKSFRGDDPEIPSLATGLPDKCLGEPLTVGCGFASLAGDGEVLLGLVVERRPFLKWVRLAGAILGLKTKYTPYSSTVEVLEDGARR